MQVNDQIPRAVSPPFIHSSSNALVPFTQKTDLVRTGPQPDPSRKAGIHVSAASEVAKIVDVKHMSPREMTDISLDLYAMGLISFDDYSALAYHPELHPEYDRTIGALTGETAGPDRKRNIILEWEDKYRFLKTHSPKNTALIDQSVRITVLLKSLARRTRLQV